MHIAFVREHGRADVTSARWYTGRVACGEPKNRSYILPFLQDSRETRGEDLRHIQASGDV